MKKLGALKYLMLKVFVFLIVFASCAGFVVAQVPPERLASVAKGAASILAEAPEVTEPVRILSKPRAPYADSGVCVSGTVTLRVTFQANGEIGKISVVSGLPLGFNESAVEAARKIKFVPARKNGIRVNSTRTIQYSFSIY